MPKQTTTVKFGDIVEGKAPTIMKGSREHRHDLFKLLVSKCQKNHGWRFGDPIMVEVEHCHFYHTINEKTGKQVQTSQPVSGHFHYIKVDFSKSRELITTVNGREERKTVPYVECSPPYRIEEKTLANGKHIKKEVRCFTEVDVDDDKFPAEIIEAGGFKDNHVHDVDYIATEIIRPGDRDAFRRKQRTEVAGVMEIGSGTNQAAGFQGLQNRAAVGSEWAGGRQYNAQVDGPPSSQTPGTGQAPASQANLSSPPVPPQTHAAPVAPIPAVPVAPVAPVAGS